MDAERTQYGIEHSFLRLVQPRPDRAGHDEGHGHRVKDERANVALETLEGSQLEQVCQENGCGHRWQHPKYQPLQVVLDIDPKSVLAEKVRIPFKTSESVV